MENTEGKSSSSSTVASHDKECVKVAVNIRPLITTELLVGCTDCITVAPGEPQVQIGSHVFTFDHIYGSTGSPCNAIFLECVAPLVDALFHGYNATVLAYGQTGSGKTYTMGTNYTGEANSTGIIPKVMETIFSRIEEMKNTSEFLIRVSFIEIFKEEVFDLLEGASTAKSAPSRAPIHIRETANGGITLAGVTEPEVRTKEEMASYLSRGSLSRATGSTNMNSESSRSHAIFTITMEQKKSTGSHGTTAVNEDVGDDILCAKLHLVDLAGSERAKRTGADGLRLKEGIHINKGLLALGNVISALGDEKKRKEGGHVPYRDSKLTRLLQDSLGGNSKTVMIACVSPADSNAEETLNTLKYANRARNIQNKAVINRDPVAAQMQRMRNQLEQLQAELLYFRGESSGTPFEELQILRHKISLLESSNAELQRELRERQTTCEHLANSAFEAQVEKDKLLLKIESARKGKSWDEIDCGDKTQDFDLVTKYVSKIQELEGQLLRLQNFNDTKRNDFVDCLDLEDDALRSRHAYISTLHDFPSGGDDKEVESPGEAEVVEKELEHSSLQDKLDRELQELNKCLEQKEAEMKRFATVDTSVLKHHYEKKVHELELEKKALMKEIDDLRFNLSNMTSASDDGAHRLKEEYLQKLNFLEAQVSELKKKQEAQSQLLRQKQRSDEAAKRLQDEIHRIKTQKVQLQQKIKHESEQFRLWKASREKEVLQLKKEGRRNEYEMHKLLALNQRQKMVLQRKTEEASMATKRLKELLEARKASSRVGNGNRPGIQALMQAIEHELEVVIRVHDVRTEYERQKNARADMAKEVKMLKEEAQILKQKNMSDCSQMSPGARNSRILALENMLATSSSTLVSMASQLSEAEEQRERVFSGKGRWNQVRSLPEAINVMNHLFNLASSSRCLLRDKEMDCREKDSVIRELKEKILRLASLVRQLEAQKEELLHKEKLRKLMSKKRSMEDNTKSSSQALYTGEEEWVYDLRKGPRSSSFFNGARNSIELLDMDTSDSDPETGKVNEEDDEEWVASDHETDLESERLIRKRSSRTRGTGVVAPSKADSSNLKSEVVIEDTSCDNAKPVSNVCCSCSKKSFCKTGKCECRSNGSSCGTSCGCAANKCTNRKHGLEETNMDGSVKSEMSDGVLNTDDTEMTRVLASQGAMLLQSALDDKLTDVKSDGNEIQRRKPLTDIGNTQTKSNVPRPNQRKKWKKSQIQIIPVPPPSTESESTEASIKTEKNEIENTVPLKLPRAMRSATSSNGALRDRNSDHADEIVGKKSEGSVASPERPIRLATRSDKENHEI